MPPEGAYTIRPGEASTLEWNPSIKLERLRGARVISRLELPTFEAVRTYSQFADLFLHLPDAVPSG